MSEIETSAVRCFDRLADKARAMCHADNASGTLASLGLTPEKVRALACKHATKVPPALLARTLSTHPGTVAARARECRIRANIAAKPPGATCARSRKASPQPRHTMPRDRRPTTATTPPTASAPPYAGEIPPAYLASVPIIPADGAWHTLAPITPHRGGLGKWNGIDARLSRKKAGAPRLMLSPELGRRLALHVASTISLAVCGERIRLEKGGAFILRTPTRSQKVPTLLVQNAALYAVLPGKGCITYRARLEGSSPTGPDRAILEPIATALSA